MKTLCSSDVDALAVMQKPPLDAFVIPPLKDSDQTWIAELIKQWSPTMSAILPHLRDAFGVPELIDLGKDGTDGGVDVSYHFIKPGNQRGKKCASRRLSDLPGYFTFVVFRAAAKQSLGPYLEIVSLREPS